MDKLNIYKRVVRLSSVIYVQLFIKIAYKKNTKILWSGWNIPGCRYYDWTAE